MPRLVLMSTTCPDTWGGVEADWEIKILKRFPADPHYSSFIFRSEISSHPKNQYLSDFISGAFVKHDYKGFHSTSIYSSL
jgi:hypothetical protein